MSDKVPPGLDGGSTDPRVVAGTHFLYGLGKGFMSDITNTGHLIGVNIDDQGVRLHTAEEWGKNYSGLGRGLVYGAQHPGEILRAVGEDNLHLTTWQTDPWLAAGETLGGMTYTVGTAVIGGELGEAAKIAEEGNAAVTAAEKVAPAWERAAELAARAGKSESLKELSGIPTNLPGLASKLYGTGDALKELSGNAHPGDDSESQTGFAPGTTQVVETSTHPFALQLEVNVYRPGTGRDDGDEGSRMLQGHVDQTELRTGVEQDQPTESPQSAEGWSSRVTEADVHAALYHGPDSHRGPGGSDPPAETPALAGQQPGPQIPAGQTPDPQTPGSQTTDGASGSSSGPPAQSTPPLQGHVDQTELRTGVEQDQPSETLPSAQGSDSRSTEADVHAELAPGQGTPMVQESVQGVVRQYPNATQPPESSIETLGSDLPVALQAQQGVLTPEMVQQALAAQPAPSAQTTDDQTPTAQTSDAQSPGGQTPAAHAPATPSSGPQTDQAQPPPLAQTADDQTPAGTPVEQPPPTADEPPPPAGVEESVQGVVRQYPNATQPPESSIETLGSDLPVALQAQQGVLTPEMVQQALAAQPAPSAQTTDDQTPTAQTPAAQTPAAQTPDSPPGYTQPPTPQSPDSPPGDSQSPDTQNSGSQTPLTRASEAAPGSVSAGATDGAPALQDHVAQTELQTGVQQDQAVDPPQPAQGSDSVHTETDVHAELVPEESSPAAQESVQGVVRQYPNATQPPESSIETLGSDLPVALQAQQGVLTPEMVQQALAAQPAPSAQTTDDQTPTAQTPAAQTPAAQTSAAQTSETQAPPTETPAPASPESSPGTTDWLTPGGENSPLFGDRTAADEAPPGDSGGDKLYVDGQGTYFTLDPDGLPQVVVPDQVGDRQAVDINATDTDLVNDAYKNGATGAVVAAEPVEEDPGSGSLLTSALAAIQSTQIETETFDQAAAGQQNETFIASENPATSGGTVEAEGAGVVTSSESGSSTETSGNSAEGGGVSGDAGANQASNDGSSSDAESSHGGSPQTGDGSGVSGDGSASAGDGSGVSGDGSASAGDGSAMTGDGSAPTVDESAPAASDPAPEVSAPPPEAEPPPPSD